MLGQYGSLNFNFNHMFSNQGITALFGPIGSGKSTIVNVIAGFNLTLNSKIKLNQKEIQGEFFLEPRLRPISIMFQEGRLIENLNVIENLNFAVKKSKIKNTNSKSVDINYIIKNLSLKDKLLKHPKNLSVGEKQLVSLGRALLISCEFLILDEPTSSLDLQNKTKVLSFLKKFNQTYKIPILLISHSIEEISQLSDEIVLINKGVSVTAGKLSEIMIKNAYKHFFGKFESGTILHGRIISKDFIYKITSVNVENTIITLPGIFKNVGEEIRLRVRARDVMISKKTFDFKTKENNFTGVIIEIIIEKETAFAEVLIKIKARKNIQFL